MAEWKVKSVDGKPVEDKQENNVEQAVEETTAPEVKANEVSDDGTIKVDLDAVQERKTEEVPVGERCSGNTETRRTGRVG